MSVDGVDRPERPSQAEAAAKLNQCGLRTLVRGVWRSWLHFFSTDLTRDLLIDAS